MVNNMTFMIELNTKQTTKMWTFKINSDALELQRLLGKGDREGYKNLLAKLISDKKNPRQFARTKGIIYEMFDEGESITLPIKFEIKGSVITWYFISPMDRTHQSFRDLIFNTAAKAHTHVKNSCETYYRGTNSLHLKAMHLYAEESEFNHNHYRTSDDSPITPVEVYEHLMAFCAQKEGKMFIPTSKERDSIILQYAVFWADFDLDIKYVAFSAMKGEGGLQRMHSQLKDIARAGRLTPDEADKQLDEFFSSEHGRNMLKLAERFGVPQNDDAKNEIKDFLKDNYRILYKQLAPKDKLDIDLDSELESPESSKSDSSSGSTRSSPREDHISSPDQIFDEIDTIEYETFAADLTKHCHSIDKKLLEDMQFDDFRKGILLYHALRTAQEVQKLKSEGGMRFHPDLITNEFISKLIAELPSLQMGSTEDEIGSELLNRLLAWVQTAPPELEEWVDWVRVNGSRGLGSELAQVRQASGEVDLRQAVPQGDRSKDSKIAEIDFDNVDLQKIFMPKTKQLEPHELEAVRKVQGDLSNEMKRLIQNQNAGSLPKELFQAKIAVIDTALAVLAGKANISTLLSTIEKNTGWDSVPLNSSIKSSLEKLVNDVFHLGVELNKSSTSTKGREVDY
jgi:hypothetical protein